MGDNKTYETENYEVVEESCVPTGNEDVTEKKKTNAGKTVLRVAEGGLAAFGLFTLVKKIVNNAKRRRELQKRLKDLESTSSEVQSDSAE